MKNILKITLYIINQLIYKQLILNENYKLNQNKLDKIKITYAQFY